MEGDGLLHPRGPLPPGIYWRRRLTVLLGVLVLIFLAARCAPGGGDPKKTSSTPSTSSSASSSVRPSGKASSTPAPTKSSTAAATKPASTPPVSASASSSSSAPAGPIECTAPTLQVSVKANATSYPAGVSPVITMTIKNAGTAPCTRDIGTAATELKITSGADRIWSSDDCVKGGKPAVTLLKPNEVKTIAVTWNRKRSKPTGDCVGADALAGNYRVEGRLGNLVTVKDTFLLS